MNHKRSESARHPDELKPILTVEELNGMAFSEEGGGGANRHTSTKPRVDTTALRLWGAMHDPISDHMWPYLVGRIVDEAAAVDDWVT